MTINLLQRLKGNWDVTLPAGIAAVKSEPVTEGLSRCTFNLIDFCDSDAPASPPTVRRFMEDWMRAIAKAPQQRTEGITRDDLIEELKVFGDGAKSAIELLQQFPSDTRFWREYDTEMVLPPNVQFVEDASPTFSMQFTYGGDNAAVQS